MRPSQYLQREVRKLLLVVGGEFGVDYANSTALEEFLVNLVNDFSRENPHADLEKWLREQIPAHFIALNKRPKWLQESEWPMSNGRPMIFVGQIDIEDKHGSFTSYYVFTLAREKPLVIVQYDSNMSHLHGVE
jgi:hypothetical protein